MKWLQLPFMSVQMFSQNRGRVLAYYTCDEAAEDGNLRALKELRKGHAPFTPRTAELAAESGNAETLEWCLGQGCKRSASVTNSAAKSGGLAMLKLAHESGCTMDEKTALYVPNDLEALQYIHEKGGLISDYMCAQAAQRGDLDVLKWLYQIGAPYSTEHYVHSTCREWLKTHEGAWKKRNGDAPLR